MAEEEILEEEEEEEEIEDEEDAEEGGVDDGDGIEEEVEEIAARVAEEPLPEGKMTQSEFLESIGMADRPGSHLAITSWAEYQAS